MSAKIINLSNKQYCHFCGSMLKPADQHMYCDDILCESCLDAELNDMEIELGDRGNFNIDFDFEGSKK